MYIKRILFLFFASIFLQTELTLYVNGAARYSYVSRYTPTTRYVYSYTPSTTRYVYVYTPTTTRYVYVYTPTTYYGGGTVVVSGGYSVGTFIGLAVFCCIFCIILCLYLYVFYRNYQGVGGTPQQDTDTTNYLHGLSHPLIILLSSYVLMFPYYYSGYHLLKYTVHTFLSILLHQQHFQPLINSFYVESF